MNNDHNDREKHGLKEVESIAEYVPSKHKLNSQNKTNKCNKHKQSIHDENKDSQLKNKSFLAYL